MTTLADLVAEIARDTLNVPTLRTRGRDALDFHEVSIWQIETALLTAYEAGRSAR